MFNPGQEGEQMCRQIPIFDDIICEGDEQFNVALQSNDPGVNLNQATSTGTVNIIDNDGETATNYVRHTQGRISSKHNRVKTLLLLFSRWGDISLRPEDGPSDCLSRALHYLNNTHPPLAVAVISADQTEYWVNEQDDLWITLHLDGQKGEGRECVVSVMTVDGTATGENSKRFCAAALAIIVFRLHITSTLFLVITGILATFYSWPGLC